MISAAASDLTLQRSETCQQSVRAPHPTLSTLCPSPCTIYVWCVCSQHVSNTECQDLEKVPNVPRQDPMGGRSAQLLHGCQRHFQTGHLSSPPPQVLCSVSVATAAHTLFTLKPSSPTGINVTSAMSPHCASLAASWSCLCDWPYRSSTQQLFRTDLSA